MQSKTFAKSMECNRCGKIIALKGNRKYCSSCSSVVKKEMFKKWKEDNPARMRELKRRDYLKRKEYINKKNKENYYKRKEALGYYPYKLISEQNRFGRERKEILERDNYECQECGSRNMILIHHIDKTGRTVKDNHNNRLDNLITLCRSCHMRKHKKDLLEGKGI